MTVERFKRIKGVAVGSAVALLSASFTFGLASVFVGSRATPAPRHGGFALTSSSCPASPLTPPAFSVCGPAAGAGPVLYPGGAASALPLSFHNGLKVGIGVSQLTVTFTNDFPVGCAASSFHVGASAVGGVAPMISGTQPDVTLTFAPGHFFPVPGGSVSTPGTSTYDATLALSDSGNQNACKNVGLSMSLSASAQYNEAYGTTTMVKSSLNPSVVGNSVTYTATVTASSTSAQDPVPSSPTGTVTFEDNNIAIGTCTGTVVTSLSTTASQATCTVTYNSTAGSPHPITAVFTNADGNFSSGVSGPLDQAVDASSTTTVMTVSPSTSTFASPVALRATVTAASGPVPSAGAVSFYLGTSTSLHVLLDTASVSAGIASYTSSSLPSGPDSLYAVYTGDADDVGSTSAVVTETVNPTSCITTATGGNLTVKSGQDVCIRSTGSVSGNVTVSGGGRLDILGGTVGGGVTVSSGGALNVQTGHVGGNVNATGATWVTVCGLKLSGNLSASSSTGFVLVGDDGDDGAPSCGGNTVSGNITLSNNTAGVEVGADTVNGGVSVSGTAGSPLGPEATESPEIEGNKISGTLSCTGNSPNPIDDGLPNSVSGTRSGQCSAKGF